MKQLLTIFCLLIITSCQSTYHDFNDYIYVGAIEYSIDIKTGEENDNLVLNKLYQKRINHITGDVNLGITSLWVKAEQVEEALVILRKIKMTNPDKVFAIEEVPKISFSEWNKKRNTK